MSIIKQSEGGKTVFAPEGRIDTNTSPEFQAALIPEFDAVKEITLDFKNVVYISSAGLRVLLLGVKAAEAAGGAMTLVNVSADIQAVFEMTGFSRMFTIIP